MCLCELLSIPDSVTTVCSSTKSDAAAWIPHRVRTNRSYGETRSVNCWRRLGFVCFVVCAFVLVLLLFRGALWTVV